MRFHIFSPLFVGRGDFMAVQTLKLKSPGKINLRLDVFGKRSDGYHDVRMLNSTINLYDDIEINLTEKGIAVECENDANVPSGEDNIVFKACKEIMAYSNKNVGLHVKIKKNIPSAAGLGGGSSNAATVILGLNQLLKIQLSKEKLMKIGLRFGSDIPFFLFGSPAIATGIGENLTKIKRLPKMPFVVVSPNVGVSTQSVYEKYEPDGRRLDSAEDLPKEFATKKAVIKCMNNDLETVTAKQLPLIDELKELLVKNGALGSQMTGSGPTVFGIFSDKEQAEKASKKIDVTGQGQWRVFVVENEG